MKNLLRIKSVAIVMVACLGLLFFSCKKEDNFITNPSKKKPSGEFVEKVVTNPLAQPVGWITLYATSNGKGICFKKGTNTYVVAMDLTAGDIIARPLYNTPNPSVASATTPNPIFQTDDVRYWRDQNTAAFAVSNCSFFAADGQSQNYYLGGQGTTTLPFVLKRSGSILASGSSLTSESYQRYLVLGKNGPNGFYSEIGDNPASYTGSTLYAKSNGFYSSSIGNTILGGLHPLNANKNKTSSVGRTFVGIKDCNGDGYKEALYILVSTSLTQQQAYDILRNEFLCDQSIMFDGDGSSQLVCNGNELVKSTDANSSGYLYTRRKFPVALQVVTN